LRKYEIASEYGYKIDYVGADADLIIFFIKIDELNEEGLDFKK